MPIRHLFLVLTGLCCAVTGQTLEVLNLSPARNANHVSRSATVQIDFNEPVDMASLISENLRLRSLRSGIITGSFSTNGNAVIFQPDHLLIPGDIISVTLTTRLMSTGGNTLSASHSYRFTVAADPGPQIPLTFRQHTITTDARGLTSVQAADIDGDGDMDVLSASETDGKIAWYENDGNQNFTQDTLTLSAIFAARARAADLDSDGDMDIISVSRADHKVLWFENDGGQNFSPHQISDTSRGALSVFPEDLDGDGDLDLLVGARLRGAISWYSNDGNQAFSGRDIDDGTPIRDVYGADLDGDGDIDVMAANEFNEVLNWYENDGNQLFNFDTVSTNGDFGYSVFASDLDSDGDLDILASFERDHKIAWHENDGARGFTQHTIDLSASSPRQVFAVDLDGDSDVDVLCAASIGLLIAWYENDGSQNFSRHTISDSAGGAIAVDVADMDGDGDLDVISGAYFRNEVAWFENTAVTGVGPGQNPLPQSFELLQNYPNPFNPATLIRYRLSRTAAVNIAVYNTLGQVVRNMVGATKPAGVHEVLWDGKDNRGVEMGSGIYFYAIRAGEFLASKKMVLLR